MVLPKDIIKTVCIVCLFVVSGAGAILGKIYGVPELVTASVGAIGAVLGYFLRGNGNASAKLIAVALLGGALGLGGCKQVSVDKDCAVKAGMTCAAEFAKCVSPKELKAGECK